MILKNSSEGAKKKSLDKTERYIRALFIPVIMKFQQIDPNIGLTQYIPTGANPDKWGLIKGIVKYIRKTTGVIEVKADPKDNNPAHALIVCDPKKEKKMKYLDHYLKYFKKFLKKSIDSKHLKL